MAQEWLYVLVVDVVDDNLEVLYKSVIQLITSSLCYAIASARKEGSDPGDASCIATVYKTRTNEHQCEGMEFGKDRIVYKVASPRNLLHPCQLDMWPEKCDGTGRMTWTDLIHPDLKITCTCQSGEEKVPYGGIVYDEAAQAFAAGAAADLTHVDEADEPRFKEEQIVAHYKQYFHTFMSTHYPIIPPWVDEAAFRDYVEDCIANDYCTFDDGHCPILLFPLISNTIDMRSGTPLEPTPSTLYALFWQTECFRIPEPGSNKKAHFKMFMNTHFSELPKWVKVDQFRLHMWTLYKNLPAPDKNGYIQVPQLFFPLISATLDMRSDSSLTPPPVDMYSLFWRRAPHSILRLEHPDETLN